MSLWKSLFGKSKSYKGEEELPKEFRNWVRKSIQIIGEDLQERENEALQKYLIQKGIPASEAGEIIIFLPTAFCRKLLPELNWLPEYYDYYSESKKVKRKYQDNHRYLIIEEETEKYWEETPNNEAILRMAGRSAEFGAINQLLNAGGKLEDIELARSYVIR